MTPLIGEIQLFAGTYAPEGWVFCDGKLLPIEAYGPLFSIIQTTYGGDGQSTFAVPNLSGRLPIGTGQNPQGGNHFLGEAAGSETVTILPNQVPAHSHTIKAKLKVSSGVANKPSPEGNYFGKTGATDPEYAGSSDKTMNNTGVEITLAPNTTAPAKPVANMQPYVAVHYIIATDGFYPSPS